MKSFKLYLNEQITKDQLKQVEVYADKIFKKFNIDVEFTRHFFDRVNDARNGKDISAAELISLFRKTQKKNGKNLATVNPGLEAVIKDMSSDINMPFVMQWDSASNEWDLIAKTVMRKKNFKTSNKVFDV